MTIDTILIDFLNSLGYFLGVCLLHLPLELLWELYHQDMKIRSGLYLQSHDYNGLSQKGYQ